MREDPIRRGNLTSHVPQLDKEKKKEHKSFLLSHVMSFSCPIEHESGGGLLSIFIGRPYGRC